MKVSVKTVLQSCGKRRAVWEDARAVNPDLDIYAVHRWFQRGSVPAKYWLPVVEGAQRRGAAVTLDQLAKAHSAGVEVAQ